jgi:hypothetical protein
MARPLVGPRSGACILKHSRLVILVTGFQDAQVVALPNVKIGKGDESVQVPRYILPEH